MLGIQQGTKETKQTNKTKTLPSWSLLSGGGQMWLGRWVMPYQTVILLTNVGRKELRANKWEMIPDLPALCVQIKITFKNAIMCQLHLNFFGLPQSSTALPVQPYLLLFHFLILKVWLIIITLHNPLRIPILILWGFFSPHWKSSTSSALVSYQMPTILQSTVPTSPPSWCST